ncbi:MAG: hypothetical protein GEV10_06190 [Streptosporangiales bacterium]|nr:hypothetical protein [Streptosporangiales bacterium]
MFVGRGGRTWRARLAAACVVLPVAATAVLVGSVITAAPAEAGRISVSDSTLTSRSDEVTISVKLGLLEHGKLGLTPPGGSKPVTVAKGDGPKTLSYTLSLSCPDFDGSCVEDGRQTPARNGRWTVTFGANVLVLGSGSESSFVVKAPPATPKGVDADAVSSRKVKVDWRKGAEPDLTSYTVAVGDRAEKVGVGEACDGSSCSATLTAPASGGRTAVGVAATRQAPGGGLSSGTAKDSVEVPTAARERSTAGQVPGRGGSSTGGGREGAFPTPELGPGGQVPGASWPDDGLPSSNPYPSFGVRPKVAPVTTERTAAKNRAIEPLAYGNLRGDVAVPVAMGLVLLLVGGHVVLWSRAGLRRGVFGRVVAAGAHRARSRRR